MAWAGSQPQPGLPRLLKIKLVPYGVRGTRADLHWKGHSSRQFLETGLTLIWVGVNFVLIKYHYDNTNGAKLSC